MKFLRKNDKDDKQVANRDRFFNDFFNEMERMFEDFWGNNFLNRYETGLNNISVDISENENNFEVEAELPGIDEDDLEVKLDNDVLTIAAEKKEEKENEEKNYYRKEIRSGKFERRFRLPKNIDKDNIKAELDNGILNIKLPKTEESKSTKKIEVSKK